MLGIRKATSQVDGVKTAVMPVNIDSSLENVLIVEHVEGQVAKRMQALQRPTETE